MAFCRECGQEIGEAKFCPECGAGQAAPVQQKPPPYQAPPPVEKPSQGAKKPILGFIGMLVMAGGLCVAMVGDTGFGMTVLVIGGVILVVALVTGNVKFLG